MHWGQWLSGEPGDFTLLGEWVSCNVLCYLAGGSTNV